MNHNIIGIYKITSPSGKIYIGQSINIEQRWTAYNNLNSSVKGQVVLYRSLLKYSPEKHSFEIVEECEFKDLNIRERYWQDFYDVIGEKGLNCVLQETDELPRVVSEDTKRKRSEALSGENNPMYGRVGELNPNYGKKMSEANKKAHSEKMKGRYKGELNPFYGKKHSEKTRKIISEKAKRKTGDLNHFYNKKHSEESREKMSKAQSQAHKDNPEKIKKLKEQLSPGTYFTPKGEFLSQRDAAKANDVSKSSIRNWCRLRSDSIVGFNHQIPEKYRGNKTWREHGFYFVLK